MLDIQVDLDANITVCRPVGELDAFTVSQFRQSLAELASSPSLLIDLSGVPFVDSAGLGALIGGIRRVRELGGDVAVACPRPTLTRLLRTTGFHARRPSAAARAKSQRLPRLPVEGWIGPRSHAARRSDSEPSQAACAWSAWSRKVSG